MKRITTLGKLVGEIRDDLDLNQTALGAVLGVSQGEISKIEADAIEPGVAILFKLARFVANKPELRKKMELFLFRVVDAPKLDV